MYPLGFKSRARIATDILGARRVSITTRRNEETRRPFVSASEIADRAANPSYPKINTNVANDIARRVSEQRDRTSLLYATIEEQVALQ